MREEESDEEESEEEVELKEGSSDLETDLDFLRPWKTRLGLKDLSSCFMVNNGWRIVEKRENGTERLRARGVTRERRKVGRVNKSRRH